MLHKSDLEDVVSIKRADDNAFIVFSKDILHDEDRHIFKVIKADFDHSREVTALKTAQELCIEVLNALGVEMQYREQGLYLAIEIVMDPKKKEDKILRSVN